MLLAIKHDLSIVVEPITKGVKFVRENWTKEDSVSLAKGIGYIGIGYLFLINILLLG